MYNNVPSDNSTYCIYYIKIINGIGIQSSINCIENQKKIINFNIIFMLSCPYKTLYIIVLDKRLHFNFYFTKDQLH